MSSLSAVSEKPVSKADYERLAAFRYALRRFLRFSEEMAAAQGLTPQQHQVLLAVQGMPGAEQATIGELAERLQLRHHSVVGLVDRLEKEKLLRREASPDDGRSVVVRLTAAGLRRLATISAANRGELSRVGPDLQAALAGVLESADTERAQA